MRQKARVDGNQAEITRQLRKLGFSVWPTHQLGKGFPDLVIGMFDRNWLIELKDPEKPPSKRKLTADEKKWHNDWRGQVGVCETIDDILNLIET